MITSLCKMFHFAVTVYALIAVGCDGSALKGSQEVLDDWEGIVGGVPANLGEFPSQVSLRISGHHICGASILNEEWIVTAAHCVEDEEVNEMSYLAGAIEIEFRAGTVHPASKIVIHDDDDIAVVKVSVPFELDGFLRAPVKLPEQDQATADGANATVIGWGRTSWGGPVSTKLLKTVVLISNQEECNAAYNGHVRATQICAGLPEGGADSCQGDSGGPLFVDSLLVGIVSAGKGCALPGYPGIYTRVASFTKWIEKNIVG